LYNGCDSRKDENGLAKIERYILPAGGHSAANPPAAVAAVDRWEEQTDPQLFHRPCSAYCVGSINNSDK